MTWLAQRLRAHSLRDLVVLAEAILTLAVSAMMVAWVPFGRICRQATLPPRRAAGADPEIARLRWAIRASARRVPWRAKCFEQGLTAQRMLRRRGVAATLHYGVARSPDSAVIAHVWVTSSGIDVTGGENAGEFAEIARFAPELPMVGKRG